MGAINQTKSQSSKRAHTNYLLAKKALREKTSVSTRSSLGRYVDKTLTAPRPTDSNSIALYTGQGVQPNNVITTSVLSRKRERKLLRNQKYINKRNGVDVEMEPKVKEVKQSDLDHIKAALWNVVEGKKLYDVTADAEGTTLGVQAF